MRSSVERIGSATTAESTELSYLADGLGRGLITSDPFMTAPGRDALRIYVLTPAFLPEIGGQENHIHELAAGLIACGVDVRVVTRRFERSHPSREVLRTVPVVRLTPTGETKGAGWRAVLPLTILLTKMLYLLVRNRRRYDVVLVSGFNMLPIAAVISGRLTGRRCVVRPESPMELRYAIGTESLGKMGLPRHSTLLRAFGWIRRWAALRVDRYIAISAEIRTGLLEAGIDPARIASIPNGIDVRKFAPVPPERRAELRGRLGLPVSGRILIYTGRLAFSKGVMMLAELWRDIAAEYPDAHLVLAGTGYGSVDSCEAELMACVAAHGLAHRVTMTGNISNVNEYLQASDLFVFPSDYEGFGLSILEAMAVGLPMVSTRVGVASDVAGRYQAEFLVEPRNPAKFKQAVKRLLDDSRLRESIGARAHREVHELYSIDAIARRHMEIFAELAGGTPQAPAALHRNADEIP